MDAARRGSLKSAIGWIFVVLAYVIALSLYKEAALKRYTEQSFESLQAKHQKVLNLFQASFYFFFEDQFVPGIKQILGQGLGLAIDRIIIFSNSTPGSNSVLFDSSASKSSPANPMSLFESRIGSDPVVITKDFKVYVLKSAGSYGTIYVFDGTWLRTRLIILLAVGVMAILLMYRLSSPQVRPRILRVVRSSVRGMSVIWFRFWRLRARILFAIILINIITAAIVFFTLVSLQTEEQTHRIEKESILFSQFSTAQVVSNFTSFFYFYYNDRFLPEIKRIIASNENLIGLRIISKRTGRVLFDSEQAIFSAAPQRLSELLSAAPKVEFSPETEEELKTRDLATRYLSRERDKTLSVVSTFRNENQDALFLVEYVFSFHTLKRSIAAIRRQILIDLVPSTGLGLLIAIIFAQLLISPIRKLRSALQRVTSGDYDVSVDIKRRDEIGDLVVAFNTMTTELKKKKELRKYLSDSTYRQIMEAPDSPDGIKLGGSRVAATVLFSDIRNFVAHCENLDAEEVTAMLNEYFSEMVDVVYKHGGEVDKFIGDALLAVFYVKEETGPTSTALQAIYCALEMRERLTEFNHRRKAQNKNAIEIGVGIAHGEIISGPIGSKDRMDFTVIGDVVNLANRIEKLSKLGAHTKVVFSDVIEEKVRGLLDYEEIPNAKIRGKEENVKVYELIGVRDLNALVRNLHDSDVALRRRSVELIGQSRNAQALEYVLAALKDRDEMTRLNAFVAVGRLAQANVPEVLDAVFGAIRSESGIKALSAAISICGRLCTTDRILEISDYLDHPSERVVANTVEALGQSKHPKCIDLVLSKLSSPNNRVKANAAMALFASGHIEVVDSLKPMLMHSDPLMRASAAFAIGELTLIAGQSDLVERWKNDPSAVKLILAEFQECVPMLVALLKDSDVMVKRQAIVALGKIKDKSAVLPIIEMIDPNNKSKDLLRDVTQALRSIGSHSMVRDVISKLSQG